MSACVVWLKCEYEDALRLRQNGMQICTEACKHVGVHLSLLIITSQLRYMYLAAITGIQGVSSSEWLPINQSALGKWVSPDGTKVDTCDAQ